jgi:multisubunit Na+/H+ antiporter MnhE subunit
MKAYWKQGVARWQLLLAYIFIGIAFAVAVSALSEDNEATQSAITRDCRETNLRNIQTKKILIKRSSIDIAKATANAKARKQNPELFKKEIEGRRDVTLALIDALAPVRNCATLVAG